MSRVLVSGHDLNNESFTTRSILDIFSSDMRWC